MGDAEDASGQRLAAPRASRQLFSSFLILLGLWSFAVAQPVFYVLGGGVAFFVAHRADGVDLFAFAATLAGVVPLLLMAIVVAARAVALAAGRGVEALLHALLGAVIAAVALNEWEASPEWVCAACLMIGAALAWVLARFERARQLASWIGMATVAQTTNYAVPALLTGRYPPDRTMLQPTLSDYEEDLFTYVGTAINLNASEWMTSLCPPDRCSGAYREVGRLTRLVEMSSDATAVHLHEVTPIEWRDRLPTIDATWRDFWSPGGEDAIALFDEGPGWRGAVGAGQALPPIHRGGRLSLAELPAQHAAAYPVESAAIRTALSGLGSAVARSQTRGVGSERVGDVAGATAAPAECRVRRHPARSASRTSGEDRALG